MSSDRLTCFISTKTPQSRIKWWDWSDRSLSVPHIVSRKNRHWQRDSTVKCQRRQSDSKGGTWQESNAGGGGGGGHSGVWWSAERRKLPEKGLFKNIQRPLRVRLNALAAVLPANRRANADGASGTTLGGGSSITFLGRERSRGSLRCHRQTKPADNGAHQWGHWSLQAYCSRSFPVS